VAAPRLYVCSARQQAGQRVSSVISAMSGRKTRPTKLQMAVHSQAQV